MRNIYAIDVFVILYNWLGACLPKDAATIVTFVLDSEEPRVLKLDHKARPLTEVAPYGVAYYFIFGAALGIKGWLACVQL